MHPRPLAVSAFLTAFCVVLSGPGFVLAGDAIFGTANLITVQATCDNQTATLTEIVPVDQNWFAGRYSWALPSPVTLSTGGTDILGIDQLKVDFFSDPEVDLQFSTRNTNLNSPVTVDVTSATIIFAAIPNAQANAGAYMTVGQGAGSPAGASITGLFANSKAYEARYSTNNVINTGTVFADLVSPFSVTGIGTNNSSEALPLDGISMLPLGATCYMIESEFKFTLSAGDQASGTSAFIVTPEPATLSFLAAGCVLLLRRRSGK